MLRFFLFFFVVFLGFAAPSLASRVALVVGNSDYENTERLTNPVNDAFEISKVLKQLGFEVIEVKNASQRDFGEALLRFEQRLDGATHALFFYAGHGMQLRGENYLLSVDAKVQNQHLIDSEAVRLSKVLNLMESRAATSIAFIDACRDNPLANALRDRVPDQARSLGLGRGLAVVGGAYSDSLVAFATTPGKIAYDGTGPNSPFTKALLSHIKTPGIEVSTMLKRVSADVLEETDGRQRPEVVSQMSREFYFRISVGTVETPKEKLSDENLATQQLNLAVGIPDQKARLEAMQKIVDTFPETSAANIARQLSEQVTASAANKPRQNSDPAPQSTQEQGETDLAALQPSREVPETNTAPDPLVVAENALGIGRAEYRSIQRALDSSGFSPGAADGLFGPRSRTALRRFEAANGLSQTGYLNENTYEMLLARVPKIDNRSVEPNSSATTTNLAALDGSYEVVVRRRWDDEYAKYHYDPYYKPGRQEVLSVYRFSQNGSDELSLTYHRDFTGNSAGLPKAKATLDENGNFKFRASLSSHFGNATIRQVTFSRKLVSLQKGQSARFEPGRFDQQFIKNVELKRLK
ncbi:MULTISPECIES: caspase family protein [unclassified Ruegeria]|uniref:caspase family protein n=2 Tax=Ruegeria TaxID=97050 RepID=UPI0014897294|nr:MULTISPECIES: caspase family protein [unclassified Ruegeria]